jgi:hypothetical protein
LVNGKGFRHKTDFVHEVLLRLLLLYVFLFLQRDHASLLLDLGLEDVDQYCDHLVVSCYVSFHEPSFLEGVELWVLGLVIVKLPSFPNYFVGISALSLGSEAGSCVLS